MAPERPENLAAVPVGGGGAWPGFEATQAPTVWREPESPENLAAVPVGGGGAWPGFETTRRAKLAARTASGRAAAHGHTEQPAPTHAQNPAPQIELRPETWTLLMVAVMRLPVGSDPGILPGSGP